ncbi:hypothetical protein SDC9_86674 [bioreactor metagenome]|uniref:Uncharacterized protein n=1 Tax=bioreactor metagenome TaxID=1076179 RepID=A0A644ZGS0_9ZZZZ
MKDELLKGKVLLSLIEVIAFAVEVEFYNSKRPHISIGMITPTQTLNQLEIGI